jgi:P27 family predicted phage terminase small subunit
MVGRKPKPTRLKLVAGNPGRRKLNHAEPKPRRGRPSAPAHVSDKARETWRYVAGVLDRMGVLTEADALALEMLCEAYADYLAARAELKAFGSNYYETTTKDGSVMHRLHPAVGALQDADRRIKSWLIEFGQTPSARSRIKVEGYEPDEHGVAAKFFDRDRGL